MFKGKNKTQKDILPFVAQYRPSVSNLKQALLTKWHLTQNQPLLRQIQKRTTYHFVQNRKILKRSACESKTIKASIHVFTQEGISEACHSLRFLILYHPDSPPKSTVLFFLESVFHTLPLDLLLQQGYETFPRHRCCLVLVLQPTTIQCTIFSFSKFH